MSAVYVGLSLVVNLWYEVDSVAVMPLFCINLVLVSNIGRETGVCN